MTVPWLLRSCDAGGGPIAAFAECSQAWNSKQIRGRISEWGQMSLSRSVTSIDARDAAGAHSVTTSPTPEAGVKESEAPPRINERSVPCC